MQGRLVDGRRDDRVHCALQSERDGPVDGQPRQAARRSATRIIVQWGPGPDVDEIVSRSLGTRAARTDEYEVMRHGRAKLPRGRGCDFRSDAARVAERDCDA
jgi:hypothetical protein